MVVREFQFRGNRVFSSVELAKLLARFTGRPVTSADLEEARRVVTRHYVAHGYINSGAILPDQSVEHGIVTFRIIEGWLSEIVISGSQRLNPEFLRRRILYHVREPLHLPRLQDALWLAKEDPNIRSIDARLVPSQRNGEARLELELRERHPWNLALQARNDRPPSIGAELIEGLASHQNVTGRGDALQVRYGLLQSSAAGLEVPGHSELGIHYEVPLSPAGGRAFVGFNKSEYAVVEEPFDELDIESASESIRTGWRQPLYRTPTRQLTLTIAAERRHTESSIGDVPFSFSPGAVDGSASSTALRLAQEWTDRSTRHLLAVRSTFSWGIDLFGSTDDGSERDGQFLTWLGQAQLIRRIGRTHHQWVLNTTLQLTESPLLASEQIALGGAHSVRGYQENQLIRDAGAVASLEFHLPIWFGKSGAPALQLAPFIDYGAGWNLDEHDPEHLASAGIGILLQWRDRFSAQVYWGKPLIGIHQRGENLQDYGIHFKLSVRAF